MTESTANRLPSAKSLLTNSDEVVREHLERLLAWENQALSLIAQRLKKSSEVNPKPWAQIYYWDIWPKSRYNLDESREKAWYIWSKSFAKRLGRVYGKQGFRVFKFRPGIEEDPFGLPTYPPVIQVQPARIFRGYWAVWQIQAAIPLALLTVIFGTVFLFS